ncbi:MAG: hypothetical protein QG623_268 [Patescibacteria group bacterium]|nr:hypothetical protein [Patescibacteria group bacterium]
MDPALEPKETNLDPSKPTTPIPPITSSPSPTTSAPISAAAATGPAMPGTSPVQPTTTNPDYAFPPAGAPEPANDPLANSTLSTPPASASGASSGFTGSPLESSSDNPNPTSPLPEYIPDAKPKKKILKGLMVVILVAVLTAVGGIIFLKSRATSTAALKEFSSATSGLSSESSALSSSISSSVTVATNSSTINDDIKAFDEALAIFEQKTANLKSDRKALKAAAESYIKELKDYRLNSVVLAIDVAKVNVVTYKLGVLIGANSAALNSVEDVSNDITRVNSEIDKNITELKALELSAESAKDYRDKSVQLAIDVKEILEGFKVALAAGDNSAILTAQSNLRRQITSSAAVQKEKEIIKELGYDSEPTKKVEAARKALNDEIDKVNKNR